MIYLEDAVVGCKWDWEDSDLPGIHYMSRDLNIFPVYIKSLFKMSYVSHVMLDWHGVFSSSSITFIDDKRTICYCIACVKLFVMAFQMWSWIRNVSF